jgi:Flp pilus assembly protein TadG
MVPVNRLRWTKLRQCEGAAIVEFAISASVLLLIVLGIIEFGFLWYQKQVITNASREAARYGVTYQTTAAGARLAPHNITSPKTIQQVVNDYCTGRIPDGSWSIAISGAGYTAANGTDIKGWDLIVQVTCQNRMDLLSGFIPGLANISFTAKTIMKCE